MESLSKEMDNGVGKATNRLSSLFTLLPCRSRIRHGDISGVPDCGRCVGRHGIDLLPPAKTQR